MRHFNSSLAEATDSNRASVGLPAIDPPTPPAPNFALENGHFESSSKWNLNCGEGASAQALSPDPTNPINRGFQSPTALRVSTPTPGLCVYQYPSVSPIRGHRYVASVRVLRAVNKNIRVDLNLLHNPNTAKPENQRQLLNVEYEPLSQLGQSTEWKLLKTPPLSINEADVPGIDQLFGVVISGQSEGAVFDIDDARITDCTLYPNELVCQ